MISTPVNWAIVGTGGISHSVVPDLRRCELVQIAAVHSRSEENAASFAAAFNIPRWTTDYSAITSDPTIDVVYIATPISTHHRLAIAALEAGKHVLVEKPMASQASEVEELFNAAADHGVFLMEGMWMKFNPAFRRLHEELQNGTIGEPRNIRAAFSIPFPQDEGSRWDPERGGSALLDQGIYPVTLVHSVFGIPATIHASGELRADGLDLSQHFPLEFDNQRFAQCTSGVLEFSDPSASISGERGWISLPAPFWATTSIEIHAGASYESVFDPPRITLPREGNGYVPMLREVDTAIRNGATQHPVHDRQDTVEVFTILDAIRHQLSRGGSPSKS